MRDVPPRRIGIDARRMLPGGPGRYLREHLARLPTEAPDIRFVAFAHPRDQSAVLSLSRNLEIYDVRGAPFTPWGEAFLFDAVRRARLDLFHAPTIDLPFALPCRSVVTVHDVSPTRFPESARQSWLFGRTVARVGKRAQLILAVSDEVARDLGELMQGTEGSIRVVPNGVADSFAVPGADDRSEIDVLIRRLGLRTPYAVNITNGTAAKGVDHVLAAMRRIRGLQMVMIGEGSDAPRVRAMVAAAQLGPERIKLLGNVSEREMGMLYRRARVAVVASRYEGFGLPAVEAMACGVPLVATKTGAIPAVTGGSAVLIEPDAPAALAEAIYRVAFSMTEAERAHLAESGRTRALRFGWQSAVRLTAAAYRHVFAHEMSDESC